ncbi:MAG: response regulator [Bacteroidetes bacterium]|jgi:DNA-binding NarL/FixJ family response regulator|nr:response regulator [Bacteroidota bacterium]
MDKISIIIVDDHRLFRNGLKFILNESKDLEVIADVSDGKEFLTMIDKYQPDLVLMDINMPNMNGIEASKLALEKYPDLKILVLSMFGDEEYYNTMIDIGVKGFILKDVDNQELKHAIRKVADDGSYFSSELLLRLIKNKPEENTVSLTTREKEVLQLICSGFSNHQISEKLFISQRTVERHRASLLEKTDAKNSISLVVYAIKNHLVEI